MKMRIVIVLLVTVLNLVLINLPISEAAPSRELETSEHKKRTAFIDTNDSFQNEDNEDLENADESREYSQLGPSDIQAYLYGRSLKKGFNAWAGRRDLEDLYKILKQQHATDYFGHMLRQRRRPWGGSA